VQVGHASLPASGVWEASSMGGGFRVTDYPFSAVWSTVALVAALSSGTHCSCGVPIMFAWLRLHGERGKGMAGERENAGKWILRGQSRNAFVLNPEGEMKTFWRST
jgi:hypothetical protein